LEFRRDATGFLSKLAFEFGDIAHFRIGAQHVYQLNHPDLIRDVLVTNHRNFVKTRGLERAKRVVGTGLLSSDGEFHLKQRRLAQPAFSKQRVEAYGAAMTACADKFSRSWTDGATVDMAAEMLRPTLSIVGHTLFGADTSSNADELAEAMTVVFEYFHTLTRPFAGLLERLPLPSNRRFSKARALLDETVYRIIRERRSSRCDEGDFLSKLLLAVDDEGDGTGMTDAEARDEIMTMFLAGHETTATMLTWTIYLLAVNPEAEARFHVELDEVLGGRLPTVDDLPNLRYTRMILAESMRIYPPVWAITRRALEDYPVGDYVVRAGSIVGMSQFVMHRDERYFTAPYRFDPLRWTPEEAAKRPRYSYFPFGGGIRQCIGEGFAWMEGILLLATLCQRWRADVLPGYEPKFQPLLTLRPRHGLPMTLTRRQSPSARSTELVGHEAH
jgi:cytochrome P450